MLKEQGANGSSRVVFEVALTAKKPQIAAWVKELFGVGVRSVRTMNMRGKNKRVGRYEGRKSDWKKAIVTLLPGEKINFEEA